MTNHEQNKAIAEATGIRDVPTLTQSFTSSLDWMRAEATLTPEQFINYVDRHLFEECRGDNAIWSTISKWAPAMVHATAAQKAESFLRTLNLWVD